MAACSAIGAPFICQVLRIYVDMLELYKAVSGHISQSVVAQGEIATKTPRVRGFRTIKKEILKLVETYVQKADDLKSVNEALIPRLLEAILVDYANNVPSAREAEVLSVVAVIVSKLGVSYECRCVFAITPTQMPLLCIIFILYVGFDV